MTITSRSSRNPWHGMIFVGTALLVVSLNNTILTTVLPVIARDLDSSAGQIQWLGDAYILVFAALLLTAGALSDHYGRKLALEVGVVVLGLTSVLAGLATNTELLLAARALQGAGAALIMPATLSMVTTLFPVGHDRANGIAVWSAVFGVGVGIGPLVGGWLAATFHWSYAFYVNLPFAIIALVGSRWLLPETRDADAPHPDIPGLFLSATALFALVFALIEAGSYGWSSPNFVLGLSSFGLLLFAFVRWEQRSAHPMLPLWLFRNMSFSAASVGMILAQFTLIGLVFYLPQFMQAVLGYDPWQTAIRFMPIAGLAIVVMLRSPSTVRRLGIKWTVAGGFLVASIGLLALAGALAPDMSYWVLAGLAALVVLGVDNAIPAATMSIMGSVPSNRAGVGSAMNEMTGQIGGALGIATLGSLVNLAYRYGLVGLQTDLTPPDYTQVTRSIFSAQQTAETLPSDLGTQVMVAANRAYTAGLADALTAGAFILLAVAVLTWLLLPARIQAAVDPAFSSPPSSDAAGERLAS